MKTLGIVAHSAEGGALSTRLLAKHAVLEALDERPILIKSGWLPERKVAC
jgi:hypothetical protein